MMITLSLIANELDDIKSNFTNITNEILKIVQNKTIKADIRNDKIVKIITPMFDFRLMAKLSLGKKWRTLS